MVRRRVRIHRVKAALIKGERRKEGKDEETKTLLWKKKLMDGL